jgi:hypothetical protein
VTAALAATPTSLRFAATEGGTPPPAEVVSVGGVGLPLTVQVSDPWLSVRLSSTVAPARLTVSGNSRGLAAGTYTGTITVDARGAATGPLSVPVTLTVAPAAGAAQTVEVQVQYGDDDASESWWGGVRMRELALRAGRGYMIGLRFQGVPVPAGAVVSSATLRLHGFSYVEGDVQLEYRGEAADDSAPISPDRYALSNRSMTEAFVSDAPAAWQRGAYNDSPELRAIVQEIVSRPGWNAGNAMTVFIVDDGSPRARLVSTTESALWESRGAILRITYTLR